MLINDPHLDLFLVEEEQVAKLKIKSVEEKWMCQYNTSNVFVIDVCVVFFFCCRRCLVIAVALTFASTALTGRDGQVRYLLDSSIYCGQEAVRSFF